MNSRLYVNALGRLLNRGSERKRLRQLTLAQCLAPGYLAALEARDQRHSAHADQQSQH